MSKPKLHNRVFTIGLEVAPIVRNFNRVKNVIIYNTTGVDLLVTQEGDTAPESIVSGGTYVLFGISDFTGNSGAVMYENNKPVDIQLSLNISAGAADVTVKEVYEELTESK